MSDKRATLINTHHADWQSQASELAKAHEVFTILNFEYSRHHAFCDELAVTCGWDYRYDPTKRSAVFDGR